MWARTVWARAAAGAAAGTGAGAPAWRRRPRHLQRDIGLGLGRAALLLRVERGAALLERGEQVVELWWRCATGRCAVALRLRLRHRGSSGQLQRSEQALQVLGVLGLRATRHLGGRGGVVAPGARLGCGAVGRGHSSHHRDR